MTTTFDFQDGSGPVPAHQHTNGGGWVANTAQVSGDARVSGTARVDAPDRIVSVGPVGTRYDTLTAYWTAGGGIEYTTRCFRGTYAELKAASLATHGERSEHYAAYGRAATALYFLLTGKDP